MMFLLCSCGCLPSTFTPFLINIRQICINKDKSDTLKCNTQTAMGSAPIILFNVRNLLTSLFQQQLTSRRCENVCTLLISHTWQHFCFSLLTEALNKAAYLPTVQSFYYLNQYSKIHLSQNEICHSLFRIYFEFEVI